MIGVHLRFVSVSKASSCFLTHSATPFGPTSSSNCFVPLNEAILLEDTVGIDANS